MELVFVYDEFQLLEAMHNYKQDQYIIMSDVLYGMITQIYQLRIAGYNIQIVTEKQEVILQYDGQIHKIQYYDGKLYHNSQLVNRDQRTIENRQLNLTDNILMPNNLLALCSAFNSVIHRVGKSEPFTLCVTPPDLLRQITPFLKKEARLIIYGENVIITNNSAEYYNLLITFDMPEIIRQRCYKVFNFAITSVNGKQIKNYLLQNQKILVQRPDWMLNVGFIKESQVTEILPDVVIDIEAHLPQEDDIWA